MTQYLRLWVNDVCVLVAHAQVTEVLLTEAAPRPLPLHQPAPRTELTIDLALVLSLAPSTRGQNRIVVRFHNAEARMTLNVIVDRAERIETLTEQQFHAVPAGIGPLRALIDGIYAESANARVILRMRAPSDRLALDRGMMRRIRRAMVHPILATSPAQNRAS